jgi:hypothetical protein
MTEINRIFYNADDGTDGEETTTDSTTTTEDKKEPYKVFEKEEDYQKVVQSQRSKGKKEALDDLGSKSLDEAREKFSKTASLETELNETKSKYKELEEQYTLSEFGVKDDYKEEVLVLAKGKVNEETTLKDAMKGVVEKMPFVTGKKLQQQVGTSQTENNDNDPDQITKTLAKKYPWIK